MFTGKLSAGVRVCVCVCVCVCVFCTIVRAAWFGEALSSIPCTHTHIIYRGYWWHNPSPLHDYVYICMYPHPHEPKEILASSCYTYITDCQIFCFQMSSQNSQHTSRPPYHIVAYYSCSHAYSYNNIIISLIQNLLGIPSTATSFRHLCCMWLSPPRVDSPNLLLFPPQSSKTYTGITV